MNRQLEKAVATITEQCLPIQEAAVAMGISQMYFRRLIHDGSSIMAGLEKLNLFGRILFTKDSISTATDLRIESQAAKQAAKEEAAAEKSTKTTRRQQHGPTLNELRLIARNLGVPYSNKNKGDLVAAIEESEPGASGIDLADRDPEKVINEGVEPVVEPEVEELSLDSILAE